MRIEKVYTTSKGSYWSKEDAKKKAHRIKTYGSRPSDPIEYEAIQETFVLIDDQYNIFELSKVHVE